VIGKAKRNGKKGGRRKRRGEKYKGGGGKGKVGGAESKVKKWHSKTQERKSTVGSGKDNTLGLGNERGLKGEGDTGGVLNGRERLR